jgi:hypothetical protein
MRATLRPVLRAFTVLAASVLASTAQARMEPMEDSELATVTGQANFNLTTDSHDGLEFTRLNFGLDVATQLNIKKLQLGLYGRTGEVANTADIDMDNFALGSVNDATGQINPFNIKNPFIELAYNGNKVVGIRLGFGEAQGHLSGDIKTVTGNIPIDVYGKGSYLASKITCGWDFITCLPAKGLVGSVYANSDFSAPAQLITATGEPDPVRAAKIGIKDGTSLSIPAGSGFDNFLLGIFKSQDCNLLGVKTCFGLDTFKTFPIGKFDTATQQFDPAGAAKGVFLSMQTQDLKWRDQQDKLNFVTALAGAFLNLPRDVDGKAVVTASFEQALNGIPRIDTCLGTAAPGGC